MTALSRRSGFIFPRLKLKVFRRKGNKTRKASKKTKEPSCRYDSPQRSKSMPHEIDIIDSSASGKYSPMSQVSGTTDLIAIHTRTHPAPRAIPVRVRARAPMGHSMMRSALPTLETDSASVSNSRSLISSSLLNLETPSSKRRIMALRQRNYPIESSTISPALKLQLKRQRAQNHHYHYQYHPITLLTNSHRFQTIIQHAFETIDTNQSGTVDHNELYAGLLLLHLNMAAYLGPAACRPAPREHVEEIFQLLDTSSSTCRDRDRDGNQSGTLDREEFGVAVTILMLSSGIGTRVLLQLGMMWMIVPILARWFLDAGQVILVHEIKMHRVNVDVEVWTERVCWFWSNVADWIVPAGLKHALLEAGKFVPDDAYDSLPLTIVSWFLGMLLVPWMLYQMDEFYHWIASTCWRNENENDGKHIRETTE